MNNKVLISLFVPRLEVSVDIFIPVNRKIKNIIKLIAKTIPEISNKSFTVNGSGLYNQKTGQKYDAETRVMDTDIRNGTDLIIL